VVAISFYVFAETETWIDVERNMVGGVISLGFVRQKFTVLREYVDHTRAFLFLQ